MTPTVPDGWNDPMARPRLTEERTIMATRWYMREGRTSGALIAT